MHDAAVRVIRSPRGETRDQAKNDIAECFRNLEVAYLEVSLGGPYFGGQRIGFLDIAVVPYICWVDAFETMGEYKLPIEHQCPNLHAWFTFIITHPSVKESLTLTPSSKVVEFCKLENVLPWYFRLIFYKVSQVVCGIVLLSLWY